MGRGLGGATCTQRHTLFLSPFCWRVQVARPRLTWAGTILSSVYRAETGAGGACGTGPGASPGDWVHY